MSRLRRPTVWYASWMNFSDDANSETIITNRRKEADELVHNIRDGHFDADTLDELTQVLDHEILFLQMTENKINQQRRSSNALMLPWTGKLVPELSRCLFQTIYPESYYERELQFRALFSTLVLQRVQGTAALQFEHHDALWKQFQKGYKDLQWQRPWAGEFTRERFRKYQCSYMLVSIAEYAKNFKREEPVVVDLLSRITRLLIAGGSMAMSATTGMGGSGLQPIIQVLDDSFRPLCRVPEERFNDFFVLQEITRIALAFHLRSQVIGSVDATNLELISSGSGLLSHLTTSILERILLLLNNDFIEEKVSQPTNAWRNFLAFTDRGPPCFNDYYYLYGLLDCATQLGRIVDKNAVSLPFEERVRKIIRNSKDSSIRWKAIEFLVTTNLWKDDEVSPITVELKVIKACLDDETITLRPPSLSSPRRSSSSPSLSTYDEIKSIEWMESEADFPSLEMKTAKDCPRVILPKGVFELNNCYSAGLSPNCGSAYFLREKDIIAYSLSDYPIITEKNVILKRTPGDDEDYKDTRAVLTNRFLAVLSRGNPHRLSVYEHGSLKAQEKDVGSDVFDMWYPTCISMFEASNRTWVAIGGHSNRDGQIRLYRIEDSHGKLRLKKHDAQFENCLSNALSNDWPKTINFGPDGRRLICVTKNKNKVLVWFLSNNARPRQAPFQIMKSYEAGITARGIDSVSLFYSPSKRPYVFCTTVPSDRRNENGGEWPFISPVHFGPATVPEQLEHAFYGLKRSAPMIAGAVSADGRIAAMLENSGNLILHALRPSEKGGICPSGKPVVFKKVLGKHNNALLSNTSIRFHFSEDNKQLCLFAVDIEGRIFRSTILGI